jgi:hypothetical protein
MLTVFLRHWNEAAPVAAIVKITDEPAHADWVRGFSVTTGTPAATARAALELGVEPQAFDTMQS